MIETGKPSDARRPPACNSDEYTLIERLVDRQGLSRDEAVRTVGDYRKGKRVEIDPATTGASRRSAPNAVPKLR